MFVSDLLGAVDGFTCLGIVGLGAIVNGLVPQVPECREVSILGVAAAVVLFEPVRKRVPTRGRTRTSRCAGVHQSRQADLDRGRTVENSPSQIAAVVGEGGLQQQLPFEWRTLQLANVREGIRPLLESCGPDVGDVVGGRARLPAVGDSSPEPGCNALGVVELVSVFEILAGKY